ncbi:hypothetical protein [Cellulomonas cellasea]|uniref:Uncharacterized protein n=2 Tax=Cellulomonas cellasea TaxID=43670 RepID=A0A0A0BCM2_9CELL|nr:hypothetical protein [Cellulomonas cellasea]KGM03634.1 hypothetical protein Q760_17685 [Cellulomonas cellasea DSM 20118]GEA87474.1 hypothetical protein CCE01nite_14230 [Cellulomonas cellasea]
MPTPLVPGPTGNPVPARRRRSRGGALTAGLVGTLVLSACSGTAPAAEQTPDAAPVRTAEERLVVADPVAAAVHTYSVPEHELLGTLEDLAVQEHAGFVQLEDGRLLLADKDTPELLALDVSGDEPAITDRVALPGSAVHIAVDPDGTRAVVSTSADPGTGLGALTVVDLATFEAEGSVPVATEEPGIALVGDALLHRDGAEAGRLEAFALADVLDGSAEPVTGTDVGAYGHGEAVVDGHLLLATDAGLERFHVDGGELSAEDAIAWGTGDQAWGRGYYLRVLGADDPHVWSYVRDQSSASWGEWRNDLFVVPPGQDEAQRRPLGNGLAFRFSVADDRVLFARMHPDGYVAHVVDADPASPTFLETLHAVPLPTPSRAPAREDDLEEVWESPGRPITAITAAGDTGYVSRGGDGIVDVLDTRAGTVEGTITVPTSLDGGGYLIVTRPGAAPVDTLGR